MEKLNFVAIYNDNGQVVSIKPAETAIQNENKIEITEEVAKQIIDGTIGLGSLEVIIDADNNLSIQVVNHSLKYRMNKLLYRIRAVAEIRRDIPGLILTLDQKINVLKITANKIKKDTITDDAEVVFLITDYNDPNVIYEIIKIKLIDVLDNPIVYNELNIPHRIDVYTKRSHREYQLEIV